jgi:hypothetical protein
VVLQIVFKVNHAGNLICCMGGPTACILSKSKILMHNDCVQLEVLNTLEKNDPEGRLHCVSLLEWFDYRNHVCMVFEKLGLSLYDFLRRNGYSPFHVNLVSPCI